MRLADGPDADVPHVPEELVPDPTPKQDSTAAEIAQEQEHVDRVYRELVKAEERVELIHTEGMSRGQTERRGTGDPRDEELTGLFERDALVHSASKRRASLQTQHEGLVFGRLDLAATSENGQAPAFGADSPVGEVRYVGRLGVRDDDYEPLVIDWRAPAAAPFYRATPAQPLGVLRRRVLRCRSERVVGIEDDLMVPEAPEGMTIVGDGALMAALTRSRGGRMRDIVATIQQHQDEAIRASARGVTEITGGPGTGKTVVALHRAAYLLYSDRRRYESGGVLVVGPSAAYTAYIERVLPSLGEESVSLRSLGDVADGITATRHEAPEVEAIKGSLRMVPVLEAAMREPAPEAPAELRVFVRGQALRLDPRTLQRVSAQIWRRHQRNSSGDAAWRILAEEAWKHHPAPAPVEPEGEGSSAEEAREEFMAAFYDSADVAAFMQKWWRPIDPREVLLWLSAPEVARRVTQGILSQGEADALADSYRQAQQLGTWSVSDAPLIDELVARLGPVPDEPDEERGFYEIEELDDASQYGVAAIRLGSESTTQADPAGGASAGVSADGQSPWQGHGNSERIRLEPVEQLMAGTIGTGADYAHILIDEAQDLSPLQWRMVGRRARGSWTVVGDAAQSSWPDEAEARQARQEAYGKAPQRAFHMDTNYRNAREIFDLAAALIREHVPDADIPEAVRETGIDPVQRVVAGEDTAWQEAVEASTRELLGQVEGPVAVIVPPSRTDQLAPQLSSLGDRVLSIDPLSTKGLEWDATVVVDPDAIAAESPGGPRTLYVALTRAAHRMHVLRGG